MFKQTLSDSSHYGAKAHIGVFSLDTHKMSSNLMKLIIAGASIEAVKADLWDNHHVDNYINIQHFKHGTTALMFAVRYGSSILVELLLKEGADVNAQNKIGNSALIIACNRGNLCSANVLIAAGADINTVNNDGYTALISACASNFFYLVKLCLEAGANINLKTNQGLNALDIAKKYETFLNARKYIFSNFSELQENNKEIIRLLESHLQSDNYAVINGKRYLLVESPSK